MSYSEVFPDPLVVQWLTPDDQMGGRREFSLYAPHRQFNADGSVHLVEQGDLSDGASIPRFLWRFESPYGRSLEAAVHHDQKYRKRIGTRKAADDQFLEGLKVLGIPAWKRQLMYWGVRTFGGSGWGS